MDYLDQFFALKCCGDVLNITAPITHGSKEITEAMGMRERIKALALARPMHYSVVDLCAGNGLVGVLAAFTLPVRRVVCVDQRVPSKKWHDVRRFSYENHDINYWNPSVVGPDGDKSEHWIVTACHACGDLSRQTIRIYEDFGEHLVLMPCCPGPKPKENSVDWFVMKSVGRYQEWSLRLARECGGSVFVDQKVLSPRNTIITKSKESIEELEV